MEKESKKPLQLNIREVIKTKNPRLWKFLPGFVLRWIEMIIRQRHMNDHLMKLKDYEGLEWVGHTMKEFKINMVVNGAENIPKDGRLMFVANHPLGGLESLGMMDVLGKYHPNMKFLVNDILLTIDPLKPLFVPINKHGGQAKEAARLIEDAYASDDQILFYPAGLVSRKVKGKITDLEWKKNFITKVKKHKRDVIPIYIDAKNTPFFYNLANWRKKLGIKANIEMFLLPDQVYRQIGNTITYNIGKPIPYETFDKSKTPVEWAAHVKEIVYQMKK